MSKSQSAAARWAVVRVHCDDEHADAPDYALVEITPGLLQLIEKRSAAFRRIQKSDSTVFQVEYFDCGAVYFAAGEETADLAAYMDEHNLDYVFLDKRPPVTEDHFARACPERSRRGSRRVEARTMLARDGEVAWDGYLKHTSIHVQTEAIPLDALRRRPIAA